MDRVRQGTQKALFNSKVFPLVLVFGLLAILFVLFRMKAVEIDYSISATNKDIEKIMVDNKELKAEQARLLSTTRLRKLAKDFELAQPRQDQIIVIQ
jgi:cell division protein FtsL